MPQLMTMAIPWIYYEGDLDACLAVGDPADDGDSLDLVPARVSLLRLTALMKVYAVDRDDHGEILQ